MPTYVYECAKCGQRFEAVQKISDAALTEHEGCGGKVERVIVPAGFILKGGGWYKDLYSSSPKKNGGDKKD